MASPFAEAIVQSMVASMDPTVAMQRDAMQSYVDRQAKELKVEKAKAIAEVGQLLSSCNDKTEPAVKEAYRAILRQLAAE